LLVPILIDPQIRAFLAELNKDSSPFWTLPGPQVRATLTALQDKYPVDMSGITTSEKTVTEDGRRRKMIRCAMKARPMLPS
jgi:acetyl esterase